MTGADGKPAEDDAARLAGERSLPLAAVHRPTLNYRGAPTADDRSAADFRRRGRVAAAVDRVGSVFTALLTGCLAVGALRVTADSSTQQVRSVAFAVAMGGVSALCAWGAIRRRR